jgi:hypothetical protein
MADYETRYAQWLSPKLKAQIYIAAVDAACYWADPAANADANVKAWVTKYFADPAAMAIRMAPLILGRPVVKDAVTVRDEDVRAAVDQILTYFITALI